MKTIKSLSHSRKKVYIRLNDSETAKLFAENATREGITFSDGSPVTAEKLDDVMALLPTGRVCYVGYIGRIYSHSKDCLLIDYKSFIEV